MVKLVCIFDPFGTFSAAERDGVLPRVLDYFNFYSKKFEKIYVITLDVKRFSNLPRNVVHMPFREVPFKKYFYLLFAGILNYRDVDCVEGFYNVTSVLPAWIYKLAGKKIFLHQAWDLEDSLRESGRNLAAFFAKILQIIGFRMADAIGVATERLRRKIVKYVDEKKVFLLPNYVDTHQFKKLNTKKIRNLIIFVGRLHPDKNLHMLLEVMRKLPKFKLWIIGTGPLKEDLMAIKEKYRLKNVYFLGAKSHEELPMFLNRAEAFIMVSHREGHPLALIEAMACELPCIGANVPGINDVIINGETGLLCEKEPEAIRKGILKLFGERRTMKELGKNARKFVVENCSKSKLMNKEIEAIYKLVRK